MGAKYTIETVCFEKNRTIERQNATQTVEWFHVGDQAGGIKDCDRSTFGLFDASSMAGLFDYMIGIILAASLNTGYGKNSKYSIEQFYLKL